jgi:pimeloyl-ACP methyl ester carboxylesterase
MQRRTLTLVLAVALAIPAVGFSATADTPSADLRADVPRTDVPRTDLTSAGPKGVGMAAAARDARMIGEAQRRERPCLNGAARCGRVRVALDPSRPSGAKIGLYYERYPHTDRSRPDRGTIVAVEGGPGYPSTESRAYYRDLFAPMMDRYDLLLVDNRGTGRSAPIRCPQLQSYQGNRNVAIARCGRKLGPRSDLYGTALAADDLATVLDRLGIRRVHLYGDSYGTFFGQVFAVRHPDRLRTLVLDAAYFAGGRDPYYIDTNRAIRDAFNDVCERSAPCRARERPGMSRIRDLVERVRRDPIVGRAPNADGVMARTRVDASDMIDLLTAAATTPAIYRELDAAARAVLRHRPYTKPLLRLVRENTYVGGAGPVRWWSEGLYVAVSCNDYPQPYDMTAGRQVRERQFQRSINRLKDRRPKAFAPFTVREWVRSPYGYFDDCLRWPKPSRWRHPLPQRPVFPDVPTLVLAGDLDSLTSPEGARDAARAFPNSTYVEVANMTHVAALVDFDTCASRLVRRFVRTGSAGDTSCARRYHENRLVERFVPTARATRWHGDRRTARVAAATVADVQARWWSMLGSRGVGLQGGRFEVSGGWFAAENPVVRWKLRDLRWVRDVAVSGRMTWERRTGRIEAHVRVTGSGAEPGRLRLVWNDTVRHPTARVSGVIGGKHVVLRFPAP